MLLHSLPCMSKEDPKKIAQLTVLTQMVMVPMKLVVAHQVTTHCCVSSEVFTYANVTAVVLIFMFTSNP